MCGSLPSSPASLPSALHASRRAVSLPSLLHAEFAVRSSQLLPSSSCGFSSESFTRTRASQFAVWPSSSCSLLRLSREPPPRQTVLPAVTMAGCYGAAAASYASPSPVRHRLGHWVARRRRGCSAHQPHDRLYAFTRMFSDFRSKFRDFFAMRERARAMRGGGENAFHPVMCRLRSALNPFATMQSLAWEQCNDEGACLVTAHDV